MVSAIENQKFDLDGDVEYSLDGSSFSSVSSPVITNHTPLTRIGATEVDFDPVVARYIRISNAINDGVSSHTLLNQVMLHGPMGGTLASDPGANGMISFFTTDDNLTVTLQDAIDLENIGPAGSAIGVLSFEITGPDAALFDLPSFTETILFDGESALFDLELSALASGPYNALLTFTTNVGDISFNLQATHVPEPSSFLLIGLGALGLMRRTRRPPKA